MNIKKEEVEKLVSISGALKVDGNDISLLLELSDIANTLDARYKEHNRKQADYVAEKRKVDKNFARPKKEK